MKWLSNSTDHRNGQNQHLLCCFLGQTHAEAQRGWDEWTKDKVFGPPKAGVHSQEELEEMGLIGVYEEES